MKTLKNILWAVVLVCALPILSGCSAGELEKPEIKTLDAPVVTAILNDVKVSLEWTPVINATSYKVEYKNATEAEFAPAGTVSYSPFVFENLELSNTYDFRVKALCGETESAWAEIVTVEVVRLLPVPAVTFNPGITYIDVKWKAIEGVETYRVEYKAPASEEYEEAYKGNGTDVEYAVKLNDLDPDTSYDIRMSCLAEGYNETFTEVFTIKTTAAPSSFINTADEFIAWLASVDGMNEETAALGADIDMEGKEFTSATGFAGALEGQGYSIKNLKTDKPLFENFSGIISDIVIDESCEFTVPVGNKIFGIIAKKSQGATFNSVINKADVTCTATANLNSYIIMGGLAGTAYESTFNKCENSGKIKFDATGYNHRSTGIGGLVGYTESSTYDSCVNSGTVTLLADYGDPNTKFDESVISSNPNVGVNLGGVVGCGMDFSTASYCTFISCRNEATGVITFKHTKYDSLAQQKGTYRQVSIGGIVGRARGNMTQCKNYAAINVSATGSVQNDYWRRDQYLFNIGGVAGAGRYALSFESCVNKGNISFANHNSTFQSRDVSAVGGICGWQDYDASEILEGCADIFAYYCIMEGNITVTGEGTAAVGGIFGVNGMQIGNSVSKSCTISYEGRQGAIGGLVGMANGNAYESRMVKCSTFEGSILATRNFHDISSDDKYFSVGGLLGYNASNTGEVLLERGGQPCKFAGSLTCTNAAYAVGMLVGCVDGTSEITIGNADNPIQASGTFARKELEPITITSSNLNTYAIGYLPDDHKTTIHVTCSNN